jgi:hypothetical protein
MLSKDQWIWCAERHRAIRSFSLVALAAFASMYVYTAVDRWWAQGKASPVYVRNEPSRWSQLGCGSDDVMAMFQFGGASTSVAVQDARWIHAEFYRSETIGAEILERKPECVGALLADLRQYPDPYAISIVDRATGKRIYRLVRLNGFLDR